eukprot:m.1270598 g.1270598  ORF g.1270598 m.1270598 type:complete len:81 (+) comp24749_c0_seq42:1518-1760(+)
MHTRGFLFSKTTVNRAARVAVDVGGQRFDLLVDVPPPLLQRIDATWRHLVADTLGCVAADVHCQISIVYEPFRASVPAPV